MANIIKTQTVLEEREVLPGNGGVEYSQRPDEDDGIRKHRLVIDREVWEDLGRPETVTVTIEPGDRLND